MTDRYTKAVLTIIAFALVADLARDFPPAAHAAGVCTLPSEIRVRLAELPSGTIKVSLTDKVELETFHRPVRIQQVQ